MNYFLMFVCLLCLGCAKTFHCNNTLDRHHEKTPVVFTLSVEFTPKQVSEIKNAANSWNEVLGYEMIQFSTTHGFPIYMVENFPNKLDQQAATYLEYFDQAIIKVRIEVGKQYLKDLDLESLMLHEFGHALGLGHTDGTVMNPYLGWDEMRRKVDDISKNALLCLY